MTSPLREMTAAARAMRKGDYSQYVTATSRDEVGELARAFNGMAEDLGAADRRRRDMIANVSHELRTPVAALQAELENMVDGVTQPTPQTLELALAQTERLGRLVTDMLDLSRLEADVVELTCEQVPVAEFFADALDAVAFVASTSGKDLRLTSEISPSNLTIWADADRLTQVTTNLLTNAIRHSPEHGTVALRAYQRARRVVIEVGDEGPGIAPERRADVFERFHRAEAPGVDPRASAGTGLGLAIARWAVELHGGTIEVADIQPGCTMRVTLPAKGPARGTGKGSARA
jgi:signal transduction histidine kinase